ncbi:MAG: MFS transporter [Arcicella sp.]|jgi:MFS family permease|nr:MFS transporter [Arcicella sp.]
MSQTINRSRLFTGSCFALITTAMAFAIRAGIMNDLAGGFSLSDSQLGWIQFMGTFGFPIATLVGGPLYNTLGPKKIGFLAFFCHIAGITFSILSSSFLPLFVSTFLISFANGLVEAAFNPLIATMYDEKQTTTMLNRFHVWFPGGIVVGSLLALLLTNLGMGWQAKIALMYIPAFIYGYLFYGQQFPEKSNVLSNSNAENFKAIFTSPLYWFMLVCMAMTATTELGTQSWVERILGSTGAEPLLILALVTGLMAVGRFFGGEIVHRLNITGVLLASAVITTIAILLMSQATGGMVYISAILFAVGVCYFWPNMISFVAVYLPKTGAFGMSLIGGVGMVGLSIFQPIIGGWIQSAKIENAQKAGFNVPANLTGEELKKAFDVIPKEAMDKIELAAGQATLDNIAVIPAILIVAFLGLFLYMRKRGTATH